MSEWIVTVLAVLGGIGLGVLGIMDLPPVSWINELQVRWFGGYSFRVTLIVCVLLALVPYGIVTAILKGAEEHHNAEQKQAIARRLEQKPFERHD